MIAGRYTLVREVGRGGMGVVWRAVDEVLDREVALKRVGMSPGGVSPDLRRAEREARLLASLNHPNVVGIFDLVNDGDEQWLVMEYVENRTLAELVRERGPLSADEAARFLHQAASALAVAHQAGIVHRDVKPSNILVTADGQVKLSDFGIARAHTDATLTQTGLMSGSPAYLSPEVATGNSASAASDVWALGATLHFALTGRPPFEVGDNVMGALYQIVHSDPPRPENAGWLLPLVDATMTKDPADRWPMTEVRDFLADGGRTTVAAAPASKTHESTVVLPAPAPAAAAAAPAATAVAPPPYDVSGGSTRKRRRWVAPLLLLGVLALLVGLGIWVLAPGDGERPDPAAGTSPDSATPSALEETSDPTPTERPEETSGATPTEETEETEDVEETDDVEVTPSESPTESLSESPSESATGDAEEMEAFVSDYFSTVTVDPDTTWTRLTPEFQAEVGSLRAYKGFWSTIESVEIESVEADPEALTAAYTATYNRTDGTSVTEEDTLGLVMTDDSYLIASQG